VLRGIDEAAHVGLGPIKVNVVVRRGVNDDQVLPLARHFRGSGHVVRFIEFMDAGTSNDWTPEAVVSGQQILDVLDAAHPLEPVAAAPASEVASRWRYQDGAGEIGVIASISEPFCRDCARLRLSSDGQLHTCLFASRGHDIRTVLRTGASVDELRALVARLWQRRDDRYSELRRALSTRLRHEMSYLGG
jgi:cyclic pyranopterin phosphate synthase